MDIVEAAERQLAPCLPYFPAGEDIEPVVAVATASFHNYLVVHSAVAASLTDIHTSSGMGRIHSHNLCMTARFQIGNQAKRHT